MNKRDTNKADFQFGAPLYLMLCKLRIAEAKLALKKCNPGDDARRQLAREDLAAWRYEMKKTKMRLRYQQRTAR